MVNFNNNQKGKLDEKTSKKPAAKPDKVAGDSRRYKQPKKCISKKDSNMGGEFHGVREGTCKYGAPKGASLSSKTEKG